MGRVVTVHAGYDGVRLPNGGTYSTVTRAADGSTTMAPVQVTLTDAQFAALGPTLPSYLTAGASVPDSQASTVVMDPGTGHFGDGTGSGSGGGGVSGDTDAQVLADIQAALASYDTVSARTTAIAAALAPYETTSQVATAIATALATSLASYETTAQVNAAIAAAVAAIPAPVATTSGAPIPYLFSASQVSAAPGSTVDTPNAQDFAGGMFDGNDSTYWGSAPSGGTGRGGFVFDLGAVLLLGTLHLVAYHQDGRTYHAVEVETSADGSSYTLVDGPREVTDTAAGRDVAINRAARYIRYTATGSTANEGIHLVQVGLTVLASQGGTALVAASQQAGSYTLAATDADTVVEMTNANAASVTVPPHSQVPIPLGAVVEVDALGTGKVTIAAGAGVTLLSASGNLVLATQYEVATLRQRAQDVWVVAGGLSAS